MKYRKKPVVIDAVQWTGQPVAEWPTWLKARSHEIGTITVNEKTALVIPTLEGNHSASDGDWIIKGIAGEIYPCKPDIFEATYEPVTEGD